MSFNLEKHELTSGSRNVPARQTRWGTINVEDERHCEFVYLRDFLTRTHLQDLIETTSQIHYEGEFIPPVRYLTQLLTRISRLPRQAAPRSQGVVCTNGCRRFSSHLSLRRARAFARQRHAR